MRRIRGIALAALVVFAACKVERTPQHYFDHQDSIQEEREAAAAEIEDRLLAMTQALNRGTTAEAVLALSPAPDSYVLGPEAGMVFSGADQIDALLSSLVDSPVPLEMRDVRVTVGPGAEVAWFRAVLELPGTTPAGRPLRMTGIYLRDAGVWQLSQAHLSLPLSAQAPAPPDSTPSPAEPAADSAAAG